MSEARPTLPELPERPRLGGIVLASLALPGLGHWRLGQRRRAVLLFLAVQVPFFLGFVLAGNTQLEFARPIGLGGAAWVWFLAPEVGNFVATQLAGHLLTSADLGGRFPEYLPWRETGWFLSGAAGVLAAFVAAHAAGEALRRAWRRPERALGPGDAAFLTLLLPGLGHWASGRRLKAVLFAAAIGSLFLLGMALGDFADFQRHRHPWYWAGQMFLGAPGWLVGWLARHRTFTEVLAYQDAGLLFTTSAGFFNVVAALDAWQRVEDDWVREVGPAAAAAPSPTVSPVPEATP